MSFIPRVKCSRCDQSYAGHKLKCPHCGASRTRSGKRAEDTGDATARLAIKGLILVAAIIAVISMLTMNLGGEEGGTSTSGGGRPPVESQTPGDNGDEPEPTPTPSPTPTPTPPPAVTSIGIYWQFWMGFNDVSIRVGDTFDIWAEVFPTDANVQVSWDTDANTVANITTIVGDTSRVTLEGRGPGVATITATADGLTAELIVRVGA